MSLWILSASTKTYLVDDAVVMEVISKDNLSAEGIIAAGIHVNLIVGYFHIYDV